MLRVSNLLLSLSLLSLSGIVLPSASLVIAAEPTEGKPDNAVGAFSDEFDRDQVGPNWVASKGKWTIVDGVLTGQELAADKHAAVLTLARPNRNSVIVFDFMLDGTDGFHLSFNKQAGHLFRIIVAPDSVTINLDKDKQAPQSKAVQIARSDANFAQGTWYTMTVSVVQDDVSVEVSNGIKLAGTHASLDQPKPNYRFVTRGKTLRLDDVKIRDLE
ncbi:MAG: hypothetical protein KDA58_01035 [Planctomycetaceae bacterium]|nr:hypothetical protein [Planctomycetaceae bacterium]